MPLLLMAYERRARRHGRSTPKIRKMMGIRRRYRGSAEWYMETGKGGYVCMRLNETEYRREFHRM